MIQNIKYISIYKYTAEGWGAGGGEQRAGVGGRRWTLGLGLPEEGLGGRVEITVYKELLTFVLNERREERKWGDTICTPQHAHTHTSQMWVHREDWVVNTDEETHECVTLPWPCCREGPRHGNQLRSSNFSAL